MITAASAVDSQGAAFALEARFVGSSALGDTFHGYLIFDSPATVLNLFDINWVSDSDFYQTGAPFGGDTPPNSGFFGFDPDLQWDTYVSIGVMDSTVGDDTTTDPDFAFGSNSVVGGYFDANPGSPDGATDENNEVFIGQFTVASGARGDSGPMSGSAGVTYKDAGGVTIQEYPVCWATCIPTPGAGIGLLAGLGLVSRRRR
ncbi:MAG: hypothetical protein ACF8GE_11825 [Phycisphaerales bacterium JB043]